MRIESTPLHKVQTRCETCCKRLFYFDELITQAIINLAVYRAEYHEQRHPTHSTEVLIYQAAPESEEIDEGTPTDGQLSTGGQTSI